jgi:hypothetical protein
VIDIVSGASHVEGMSPEWQLAFKLYFVIVDSPDFSGGFGEVGSIVG